jgi:serine/threonine protein kinase
VSGLPRQFGNYSLLKLLAKGGMGEIYLARTGGFSHFEKYYAVKKLLKKFTHNNDVCGRFIDEAKLGARLQHPNIVQVYDLGRVSDELFMATEFVDGFDLRRVLRFCHEKRKRIPLDIALFIVREILSGLAYAHRQVDAEGQSINLIHRDISPQNVLVSFEGEVKIIDFGLAKSTQRSQETQANVLLGNFGYMSPEQARGQRLDVRTDVYSTGIVLFELVTGTKRFVDEKPLRLLEMVARPTPIMPTDRASDLPSAIDRIYDGATVPDRDGRYKDAESFRDKVTQALHKLNPRATREHLAQFLNHLFLGGQAPPEVDNDALNKSVAIQVKDRYREAAAFTKTKEDDVQDRGLTDFADGASATGSHTLMREARLGDVLSHSELTGEEDTTEAPQQAASRAPAPVADTSTSGSLDDDLSSPDQPAMMPEPSLNAPPATPWPTDPAKRAPVAIAPDLDVDVVDSATTGAPTSLYEAPSFGDLEMGAQTEEPLELEEEPDSVLAELELEELPIEPLDGIDLLELTPLAGATTLAAPSGEAPERGGAGRQGGAVVSTLWPGRAEEPAPDRDEPSMVVDFGSLPGAKVVSPHSGPRRRFGEGGTAHSLIIDFEVDSDDELGLDDALADDTGRHAPALADPIDSPGEAALASPPAKAALRPASGPSPVIRPAAQPRGRVVAGAVAKAPRSPTSKPVDPNKRR